MTPFTRRWVRWTVGGEMAGFVAPAVVGVLTADWPVRAALPSLVVAGALEGLLLGAAQAHVLSSAVPGLNACRFAGLTAGGAALAYAVGMLPASTGALGSDAPRPVLVLAAVVGSAVLLGSIGTAQFLELRRHVPRSWTWVATTAAAWLVALGVFMLVATPLWRAGQALVLSVLIGLGAALCMATVVAVLTGHAAQRLVDRVRARQPVRTD